VLSNHDQPRHVSRFSQLREGGATGDAIAKVAAAMLLTLRGTPFLYYGEEIALRNLDIPNDRALDPPARRASWLFPWWNRDQARGPMPWRPGPGAGFTTGRPWLPLPPDAETRNVERQAADPGSVLAWYRSVLALRRSTPALQRGAQTLLDPHQANVLAYTRELEGEAVLVALNFGRTEATLALPAPRDGRSWRSALSTHTRTGDAPLADPITLAPFEALVAADR
jgi:alpha-glucosidase